MLLLIDTHIASCSRNSSVYVLKRFFGAVVTRLIGPDPCLTPVVVVRTVTPCSNHAHACRQ